MKYFDESRGGFWYSSKYRPLMNTLLHMAKMEPIEGAELYKGIPQLLVMAAAIGLTKGIREPVDSGGKNRNDVFIGGWNSGTFHGQSLSFWAALIVWLEEGDDEALMLKPENDPELLEKFNLLAMGGLSYLNKKQFSSGGTDSTGYTVITDELNDAINKLKKKK
jgi:hypothetical protein